MGPYLLINAYLLEPGRWRVEFTAAQVEQETVPLLRTTGCVCVLCRAGSGHPKTPELRFRVACFTSFLPIGHLR